MAQVREELGAEALILATRRTGTGVEITAALEHALQPPATGPASAAPAAPAPVPPDPAQLGELRWHGVPDPLASALAAGPLPETLPSRLRFAALPLDSHAAPLLLTGPPGAGKSLTVARLATRLVLAGVAPLVISADTERAGAAEQLAAFTRLLGLDLIVATDGLTLARALARRQHGAPVLIDTAGIDPFSAADQVAIATLGAAAGARSVLVLPAGLDPAEAADTAAAFRAAGATMMVATRVDLARRLGGILAAAAAGLALTEAGVGPGAADGLVPLTPAYLTGRLAASTRKAS
ncbi:MAG: hypothetical protein ACRYGM_15415 [Janthinobacterium lividum]